MPIYEYICNECGQAHEALQKLSDAPLLDCPSCGESALKKKISAPGFRLSGTGWYETDFKSGNQKNLTDSGRNDTGNKDAAKQDSVKKEDKPAVKDTGKKKDAAA